MILELTWKYKQKSNNCFKEGGINFNKLLKHIKLKDLELTDKYNKRQIHRKE